MHIFKTINELSLFCKAQKKDNLSIGFVPTMGALHAGHLSLVAQSKAENELTIVSIFVNPTQFNNPDDLQKYPKMENVDIELLQNAGCDVVFLPSAEEVYAQKNTLKFDFGYLENIMEGKFRPGHFNGVATVVSKLFHFVMPDVAYFGQKDLQQCVVIETLVNDLSFDVQIKRGETVREHDGLAMSSRNLRLKEAERAAAPFLYDCLEMAKNEILLGEKLSTVKQDFWALISKHPLFKLEYFEIVNGATLENISEIQSGDFVAICISAYIGEVRLIDNLTFNV